MITLFTFFFLLFLKNSGFFLKNSKPLSKHIFTQQNCYKQYSLVFKPDKSNQKHTLRIIFTQSKTSSSEPLFLNLNVLNLYQINFFQSTQFVHKIKSKNTLHILLKLFNAPSHAYPTNVFLTNFSLPRTSLETLQYQ